MKRALVCLMLVSAPLTMTATTRDIRVVLDLSISMRANDRGKLAILSTLLLYDLAKPNPSMGDSFVVIPFDSDWKWTDAASAPPVSTHPRIAAQFGKRDAFVEAVQRLPYDAKMTYFYPGLTAAVQELEQKPTGTASTRAIVLITDGVPESPTRDGELQRIRNDLGPRLEKHGIRLYVLAFGGEADQNRDFFADMVRSSNGASLGDVFVDPNGSQILDFMLQIFSRSFGFSPDTTHHLPGTSTLDLDANTNPGRVAVVVMSTASQKPSLRLTTPGQRDVVSVPEGIQDASAPGGSYSLIWLLRPSRGHYGFTSDAASGTVAVLRPVQVTFEVLPSGHQTDAGRAMAQTMVPLRIRVRSSTGGDPGPIALSFRTCGPGLAIPSGSEPAYAWKSEPAGPAAGAFTITPEGRVYEIAAEYRADPEKPGAIYVGHLELTAQSGEAPVGSYAHRVEVHPLLAVSPLPLAAYVSDKALGRRDRACTHFAFHRDAGQLPHPERPSYPIRVALTTSDPTVLDQELKQATFMLDGLPLEFDGKPGSTPGAWYKARSLSGDKLFHEHELCVQMGKPLRGDPSRPIELKVATTLFEDPYDDFGVIQPFNLKIPIAPLTFFERWKFALLTGFTLAGALALVWFLRDRPAIPGDLRYAVGREDSRNALISRSFDPPPATTSLLGWVAERAIVAAGENRPLARVRPVDAELFQLRPARGVHVESLDGNETVQRRRGLSTLAVHRTYRLRTDRASYLFRLEYQ